MWKSPFDANAAALEKEPRLEFGTGITATYSYKPAEGSGWLEPNRISRIRLTLFVLAGTWPMQYAYESIGLIPQPFSVEDELSNDRSVVGSVNSELYAPVLMSSE